MLRVGTLTTFRQQGPHGQLLRSIALPGESGSFVLDNHEDFRNVPDGTPVLARYVHEDQFAYAMTTHGLDNLESLVKSFRDLNEKEDVI